MTVVAEFSALSEAATRSRSPVLVNLRADSVFSGMLHPYVSTEIPRAVTRFGFLDPALGVQTNAPDVVVVTSADDKIRGWRGSGTAGRSTV